MEDEEIDKLISDLSKLIELSRFYYYNEEDAKKCRKHLKKKIRKLEKIKKEGGNN